MAVNADVPISTSDAYGEDSNPNQDNGTYFNFSSPDSSFGGDTNTPQFSNPVTATSAAQSPSGVLGSLDTTTLLLIGGIVLAGLWITHRH